MTVTDWLLVDEHGKNSAKGIWEYLSGHVDKRLEHDLAAGLHHYLGDARIDLNGELELSAEGMWTGDLANRFGIKDTFADERAFKAVFKGADPRPLDPNDLNSCGFALLELDIDGVVTYHRLLSFHPRRAGAVVQMNPINRDAIEALAKEHPRWTWFRHHKKKLGALNDHEATQLRKAAAQGDAAGANRILSHAELRRRCETAMTAARLTSAQAKKLLENPDVGASRKELATHLAITPPSNRISGEVPEGMSRRGGTDIVCSPGKSISVNALLTRDAEKRIALITAHDIAQDKVLRWIETQPLACVTINGVPQYVVGEYIFHRTRHMTSRPTKSSAPDPGLHIHTILFNFSRVVIDGEERWVALENKKLKEILGLADALYQCELFKEYEKLGIKMELVQHKNQVFAEVAGIGPEVRGTFSKRHREIEQLSKELGIVSESGKKAASRAMRLAKGHSLDETLRQSWERQLTNLGEEGIAALQFIAATTVLPKVCVLTPGEKVLVRDNAIKIWRERTIQKMAETANTFAPTVLHRLAAYQAVGLFDSSEVEKEWPELLKHGFVTLGDGKWIASEKQLEREAALMAFLQNIANRAPISSPIGFGSGAATNAPLGRSGLPLDVDQQALLQTLLSGKRFSVVEGKAGSGKTEVLRQSSKTWINWGHSVVVLAMAGRTAQDTGTGMAKGSISMSLDALSDPEHPQPLPDGEVHLVIDEYAQIDTLRWEKLVNRLKDEKHISIHLAGDSRQLAGIGAAGMGASIAEIAKNHGTYNFLSKRYRQQQEWESFALDVLRESRDREARGEDVSEQIGAVWAMYHAAGRVHIVKDRTMAITETVSMWREMHAIDIEKFGDNGLASATLATRVTVMTSNVEADEVNRRIRLERQKLGEVATDNETNIILDPESGRSEVVSRGDIVRLQSNSPTPPAWFIDESYDAYGIPRSRRGRPINAFKAHGFDDRLTGGKAALKNGQDFEVTKVSPDTLWLRRLSDNTEIPLARSEKAKIRLAYAGHEQALQGVSVETNLVLGSASANAQDYYSSMSRARGETHLISDWSTLRSIDSSAVEGQQMTLTEGLARLAQASVDLDPDRFTASEVKAGSIPTTLDMARKRATRDRKKAYIEEHVVLLKHATETGIPPAILTRQMSGVKDKLTSAGVETTDEVSSRAWEDLSEQLKRSRKANDKKSRTRREDPEQRYEQNRG